MSRYHLLIASLMFVLTGAFLPGGTFPAHAYRLPDTGQTQCYDDVGNVIPCPNPGSGSTGRTATTLDRSRPTATTETAR